MNSHQRTTLSFVGGALALAIIVFFTAPEPVTPEAFADQGEPFFPGFTDPNSATSLSVMEWDSQTGAATPFNVEFANGKYTIPSHHNYPCDGKERLAKTAAALIELRKDDIRTDNPSEHVACGVVDPLDTKATGLEGRGVRLTLKGAGDKTLADIIVGKEVTGRAGFRFVRSPGEKRVYASKNDLAVSTKFVDWIESDLLLVEKSALTQITLMDYSIEETTGRVNQRDKVTLSKPATDWTLDRLPKGKELDKAKVEEILKTLDELKIVGVRPKPQGLSESLSRANAAPITTPDMMSLQSKGYYFTQDGQLLSNEGELQVSSDAGIVYSLRFGEVVYGVGEDVSAGSEKNTDTTAGPGENRYLFITTQFDMRAFPEPPKPADLSYMGKADSLLSESDRKNRDLNFAHTTWQTKIEAGKKKSAELNARFAAWYYVISSESFAKLHRSRAELLATPKA